jgi:hypothetical protein
MIWKVFHAVLLYAVSLFVIGMGGYVFGTNIVYGQYGIAVIGFLTMLIAGQIVKVSRKELQDLLTNRSENEIMKLKGREHD